MPCYNPILAVNLGEGLKPRILPRRWDLNIESARERYGDSLLLLPCGHCVGCSKQYSLEWSTRIMLEASLYEENCFITLTYDEKNCPQVGNKRDFQLFMKRLRKEFDGLGIRYFGCGEYGSEINSHRFHYHAILFNIDFHDKEFLKRSNSGEILYRSKTLEKLWPYGISSVGEVSTGSACYVARYNLKKRLDNFEDGSFVFMSRRPGIASGLLEKHWFEIGKIYTSEGARSIPRFFKKMMEVYDIEFYESWKKRQRDLMDGIDFRYIYNVDNEEEALKMLGDIAAKKVRLNRGI